MAYKNQAFYSFRFSAEGVLISPSAAPHSREQAVETVAAFKSQEHEANNKAILPGYFCAQMRLLKTHSLPKRETESLSLYLSGSSLAAGNDPSFLCSTTVPDRTSPKSSILSRTASPDISAADY